jgi:hypothetical protein
MDDEILLDIDLVVMFAGSQRSDSDRGRCVVVSDICVHILTMVCVEICTVDVTVELGCKNIAIYFGYNTSGRVTLHSGEAEMVTFCPRVRL